MLIQGNNIGQFNAVEGEYGMIQNSVTGQNLSLATFVPDLEALLHETEGTEKAFIQDAIQSAKSNDESNFLKVLKKIQQLGENVLTKITSEVFITYLRGHNLIP